MRAADLISQARRLARASHRRPRQVDLKRAVSATYYAQFHALALLCADVVVGTGPARATAAWLKTYRSLGHGVAKNAFAGIRRHEFAPQVVRFADLFVSTQELRHLADYDPRSNFKRVAVVALIDTIERAIAEMLAAPRTQLRALVALVLLPDRTR